MGAGLETVSAAWAKVRSDVAMRHTARVKAVRTIFVRAAVVGRAFGFIADISFFEVTNINCGYQFFLAEAAGRNGLLDFSRDCARNDNLAQCPVVLPQFPPVSPPSIVPAL
jgi:hypothetical protein